MPRADLGEPFAEPVAVPLTHLVASPIGPPVPGRELWEFRIDEGQVAVACGAAQAQGAGTEPRYVRPRDGTDQLLDHGGRVGDPWQHRHHVHGDVEIVRPEPR